MPHSSAQTVNNQFFTTELLKWNAKNNHRKMPWKNIKNPYFIWLSEIILQQTRVEQGLAYYEKFIAHYPTVFDLARASEQEVFKDWEGLGYYSRCRNLMHTAKYIVNECDGHFPNSYSGLLKLKGVGPYTAAAIASFAFKKPHAVVDGNVIRVLSRYFALATPYISAKDKKVYEVLANELLAKDTPDIYNQAIMDFGATLCMPKNPQCATCPMHLKCKAFKQKSVLKFPPPKKKLEKKHRHFHYLIISHRNGFFIQERKEKDIWKNLYQFYLIEQKSKPALFNGSTLLHKSEQMLSHQKIYTHFYTIAKKDCNVLLTDMVWIEKKDLQQYAFPKSITAILKRFDYI